MTSFKSTGLLFTLAALIACQSAAPPARVSASETEQRDSLTTAVHAFLGAFDSLNWPRFTGFLSDTVDAYWPRPDSAEHLRTRQEVEARYHAFFERIRASRPGPPYLHLEVQDLSVRTFGPIGLVTFQLADVPDTVGRRTIVFRHQAAGWRIIHLHASNLARIH